MSLREMMFSCRMCLSNLSSRYVRLASTGVEKGFMICGPEGRRVHRDKGLSCQVSGTRKNKPHLLDCDRSVGELVFG